MTFWADNRAIQQGIFAGESGGDYNALFGYSHRPGGRFAGTNLTSMSVGDVINFTNPRGEYGAWVAPQTRTGEVATPVGAYQVVGSTLRDAVRALGIDPSQPFDQATQDRIGQYILETQGTGAWEGYRGHSEQISTSGGGSMPTNYPTEQQPRGLLEYFGIQRQGSGGPQGDVPFYNRDRFRDTMGRAAVALNSLRMNPDPNIPAAMGAARQRRAGNRTAAWLAQQPGGAEFAAMIEAGADPAQVLMAYRQAMQPVAPDQTAAMQNYQFLVAQGVPEAEARERAFSGGVTVQTGNQVGTIPQGYQLIQDESGEYVMQPIPGGPADTTAHDAAAGEQTTRAAGVVLEDIGRLQTMLGESILPITGVGSWLSNVPGTGAHDAAELAKTIRGNIGFDRLQQMRDASPTGGALGAINQTELDTLQSVLGSLSLSQSQEQLEYNLDRLEQIYRGILRKAAVYPNAAQYGFGGGSAGGGGFTVNGQVGGGN